MDKLIIPNDADPNTVRTRLIQLTEELNLDHDAAQLLIALAEGSLALSKEITTLAAELDTSLTHEIDVILLDDGGHHLSFIAIEKT